MAHRYRHGRLTPTASASDQLVRLAEQVVASYRTAMDGLMLHEGAAQAFRLVDAANEFIAATEPWTLAKDPAQADRLGQVLFDAAETIRLAAVLLEPIMPTSCREILRRIGAPPEGLDFDNDGRWRGEGQRTLLQEGPLWPRVDETRARAASAADVAGADAPVGAKETKSVTDLPLPPDQPSPGAHSPAGAAAPAPAATAEAPATASPATATAQGVVATASDRISIEDFMKVELRVAKVLAAEKVEKSKKLLKLSVDVGTEHRTLVAGIAEAYEPESLVGKTVVVVFNLKPAKLMGIESNGMVLAASPDGGKPEVVTFATPPEPGTRVR
jgi:methionyl-tRNA synthetase